jgi:ATP-dependent helicase/nuclease subunit B
VKSWAPPAVMAWDAWMSSMWRALLVEERVTALLLNRTQELAVWRSVLQADPELESLRTMDSLAAMAAEAWRLISAFRGRQRLRGAAGNVDTRSFQRWARAFERRCEAEGFITQAQLEEVLRESVESGVAELPAGEILLVGFDVLTPAQLGFVDALRARGATVERLQPSVDAERRLLFAAANEDEELAVAARWLRRFLEERPGARVAVVTADLGKHRREIDRVFREVLAPELQDIQAGDAAPYEFSIGVPLADTPMVAAALDLLRWATEALPLERVSGLLLSPYFAMTGEERGPRAEFDAFALRKTRMLRPEMRVEAVIAAVERWRHRASVPRLMAALRALRGAMGRLEGLDARTRGEWAVRMQELLEAAGWCSGLVETSVEFQTRRKWESALDELATLDFDGERVEFVEALDDLERIVRQTMFAPESREAPVQVMGPLEAAGSTFDAVWFLRAGELSWPMAVESSSLLPRYLQRELKMPGTDLGLDDEHALKVTERIARCAAKVVFSYAKETTEGRERVSAVVMKLGLDEGDLAELGGEGLPRTVVAVEELEDAASVRARPDRVIRGGARVLELQAACGFRAFAEQRLWATEVESIEPGMDAREMGTVVHHVLQVFWDQVRTQSELRSMTAQERDEALEWCIARGLEKAAEGSSTEWDMAYLEVQRQRLQRLLRGWLELELEREVAFEVKASEKDFKDVRVGPLRLSVRMDRVDMVEGGEVLIDYKTGDASPRQWLSDRPDAPQLPLYAILSEPCQLQGVGFGLVRAGKDRALKGYAVGDGVLHGKPTNLTEAATLEAQVARWRQVLEQLAEEFAAGDALVRPKQYPMTCTYCKERLLCRLDVSSLEGVDEEEESDGESERG